jgi:hypothetical protein
MWCDQALLVEGEWWMRFGFHQRSMRARLEAKLSPAPPTPPRASWPFPFFGGRASLGSR